MENLDLSNNLIEDIDCLSLLIDSVLSKINYLNLSHNQIKSIDSLKNFLNIFTLDLNQNRVDDLTPLSNMINLRIQIKLQTLSQLKNR